MHPKESIVKAIQSTLNREIKKSYISQMTILFCNVLTFARGNGTKPSKEEICFYVIFIRQVYLGGGRMYFCPEPNNSQSWAFKRARGMTFFIVF